MAPWITQATSYQRDVLYWREAEILAPHRQPWTGPAFKTELFHFLSAMVWFVDVEQVSPVSVARYQRPQLCQNLKLHYICLLPLILLLFILIPRASAWWRFHGTPPVWGTKIHSLLAGPWHDSQLSFQRIYASIVFAAVLVFKQEAPGCFVVVGSSTAIPTEICRTDFGQQESKQEGLSHEIPWTGCYCTITLPLYPTQRKQITSFLIMTVT